MPVTAIRATSLFRSAGVIVAALCTSLFSHSQTRHHSLKSSNREAYPAKKVEIKDHLSIFNDSTEIGGTFFISLCADVPNNSKPLQVAHNQETGHVFLILQKVKRPGDTLNRVFGFYPKGGLKVLFFKKTRGLIKDNSDRDYDVGITRQITARQFDSLMAKSVSFSAIKYHINKYNCYDYAVRIFNSVFPESPVPVHHIRFPFIFGKGGSPCSIYKDLKHMKDNNEPLAPYISLGNLKAPVSDGRDPETENNSIANQ